MWEQFRKIVSQSAGRIADNIAAFLPGVLAFLAISACAIVAAGIVHWLLLRLLRRIGFDRRADLAGFSSLAEWSPSRSPALLVARVVAWGVLLVGLLLGIASLNSPLTSRLTYGLLDYVPHLVAAVLILLVGHWAARFLAHSVLISAVNMHVHSARLLSLGVKWLVLVLAAAMALEHLGIGGQIVLLAFGILFGGIVLTLALAVGLGSKEAVSRSLERQFREAREQEEIHHL
jgi:hypothetical protein